jgi:SpoVK/Ycf46/Vps4 family AAA+-type ATPase
VGGFADNEKALLLLGATNAPWEIDDAVFRTGRFDEKLFVGLPDKAAREGILRHHFREIPLANDVDMKQVAEELEGYTGSDIAGIASSCKRVGFGRQVEGQEDSVVTRADIEEAMNRIPKSATEQMMNRYEKFREQRS